MIPNEEPAGKSPNGTNGPIHELRLRERVIRDPLTHIPLSGRRPAPTPPPAPEQSPWTLPLLREQREQANPFRPARVYLRAAVRPLVIEGSARIQPSGWVDVYDDAGQEEDLVSSSYPAHLVVRVDWLREDLEGYAADPFDGLDLTEEVDRG